MADPNGERQQPILHVPEEPKAPEQRPPATSSTPIHHEPDTRHQGAIKKRPIVGASPSRRSSSKSPEALKKKSSTGSRLRPDIAMEHFERRSCSRSPQRKADYGPEAFVKRSPSSFKVPRDTTMEHFERPSSRSPEPAAVHGMAAFIKKSPSRLPEDTPIEHFYRRSSSRSPQPTDPEGFQKKALPSLVLPQDPPSAPSKDLGSPSQFLGVPDPGFIQKSILKSPSPDRSGQKSVLPAVHYRKVIQKSPKPSQLSHMASQDMARSMETIFMAVLPHQLPQKPKSPKLKTIIVPELVVTEAPEEGDGPQIAALFDELSESQEIRLKRLECSRNCCRLFALTVFAVVMVAAIVLASVLLPIMKASQRNGGEEPPEDMANAPNYDAPAASVDAHLKQFVVGTRNPCDNLYSHACGRFHRFYPGSKASLVHRAPWLMANTIRTWIVEPEERQNFSSSFTALRKVYHLCLNESNVDRNFQSLLHNATNQIWKDRSSWPQLAREATKRGLHPHVFLNVSVILEAPRNRTIIWVGPSMDPLSPMHAKLWNEEGLVQALHLSHLAGKSHTIDLNLTKGFALGLHKLVLDPAQTNASMTLYNGTTWMNHLKVGPHVDIRTLMMDVTGMGQMPIVLATSQLVKYVKGLEELEKKFGMSACVAYFRIMATAADCGYLSANIRKACSKFKHMPPRDQFCLDAVTNSPWFELVGPVEYHKTFGNKANRARLRSIFSEIQEGLKARLRKDEWLNSIAKYGALYQVDNVTIQLGWEQQLRDFEHSQYNRNNFQVAQAFQTVVGAVTHYRSQYRKSQFGACVVSDAALLRSFEEKPKRALGDLLHHLAGSNHISMDPVGFQILVQDEKPPFVYMMATLGVWIATALIGTMQFPDMRPNQCTYPNDFWKYNLNLYERNHIHCAQKQYREYIEQFHIRQSDHENLSDYKVLSRFAGVNVAFHTYRAWLKKNGGEEPTLIGAGYSPLEAFWVIATTYQCDKAALDGWVTEGMATIANPKRNMPPVLKPRFSAHGFGYGSPGFAMVFGCRATDRMRGRSHCSAF